MFTALLFLILVNTLQWSQTPGSPNLTRNPDIHQSNSTLKDVRTRLRRLWLEFVIRSNISNRLAFRNVADATTEIEFTSVVFDKYGHDAPMRKQQVLQQPHILNYRRQEPCIDKQPAKGNRVDTCEKQRNAGYCAARLSGEIKDGLCARTCGLCGAIDAAAVGMRLTFAFHMKKARSSHIGRVLVTLIMQPTGHWQIYNPPKGSVGVHCNAHHYPSLTNVHRLQM